MSHNTDYKLVMMANQIATFFSSQPREDQVARVAGHLHDFWDPRMRTELFRVLDAGGEGLSPLATAAAQKLRQETAEPAAR